MPAGKLPCWTRSALSAVTSGVTGSGRTFTSLAVAMTRDRSGISVQAGSSSAGSDATVTLSAPAAWPWR